MILFKKSWHLLDNVKFSSNISLAILASLSEKKAGGIYLLLLTSFLSSIIICNLLLKLKAVSNIL